MYLETAFTTEKCQSTEYFSVMLSPPKVSPATSSSHWSYGRCMYRTCSVVMRRWSSWCLFLSDALCFNWTWGCNMFKIYAKLKPGFSECPSRWMAVVLGTDLSSPWLVFFTFWRVVSPWGSLLSAVSICWRVGQARSWCWSMSRQLCFWDTALLSAWQSGLVWRRASRMLWEM